LEAILKEEDDRVDAAGAILRIQSTNKAALTVIIDTLKDENASYGALMALERLGPQARDAVPSLIALLKSHQEYVVDQAERVLGKIGPAAKEAVPALIEEMKHRKNMFIIHALGEIGSPEAVPTLTELLKDPDPSLRQSTAFALGQIGPGSKEAIPSLLEALKDKNDEVRTGAIMALKQIKVDAKTAMPFLLETLKDKNIFVRGFAITWMGTLGPDAKSGVPALLEIAKQDKDMSRSVAMTLGEIGPEAKAGVPWLMELLKDRTNDPLQYDLRVQAALALWRIQGNKEITLPVLREALKDPKAYVRIEAALGLWRTGEEKEKMLALLLDMLKSKGQGARKQDLEARLVRFQAAAALGEIGPDAKAAVPILLELLGDREDFRKSVADALKKIDPAAAAKAGLQ
jgi:HEAT repeat protein